MDSVNGVFVLNQFYKELAKKTIREALGNDLQKAKEQVAELEAQLKHLDMVDFDISATGNLTVNPGVQLTPGGKAKKGATDDLILEYLKGRPVQEFTSTEISKATGAKYPTTINALSRLEKARYIVKTPGGKWMHL